MEPPGLLYSDSGLSEVHLSVLLVPNAVFPVSTNLGLCAGFIEQL